MDKKFTRWIERDCFESEKKFTKKIESNMKKNVSIKINKSSRNGERCLSSFETTFLSHQGEIENHITLVMRLSQKPCEKCRHNEHGRVFKVLGITNILYMNDWEPVAPDREMLKMMRKEVIGKNLCLDCLL